MSTQNPIFIPGPMIETTSPSSLGPFSLPFLVFVISSIPFDFSVSPLLRLTFRSHLTGMPVDPPECHPAPAPCEGVVP